MAIPPIVRFALFVLLAAPYVVKHYQYRMVPYILSSCPEVGAEEAMFISTQMTKKQRRRMFGLDLSFIGLGLLISFVLFFMGYFVLGAIFVALRHSPSPFFIIVLSVILPALFMPLVIYIGATWAQLFIHMRDNYFAMQQGAPTPVAPQPDPSTQN